MDCFVTCIRNGTTAFTGVVPFSAKEIFGFAAGRNRTVARRRSEVGAKILMCKEGLSSLANTFVALPGQTALLNGIVDGEVEISYAGPRVGYWRAPLTNANALAMELWRTLAAPCRILSSHTQTLLTLIYRSPPYLKARTRNYLAAKCLLFSLSGAGQGRESLRIQMVDMAMKMR